VTRTTTRWSTSPTNRRRKVAASAGSPADCKFAAARDAPLVNTLRAQLRKASTQKAKNTLRSKLAKAKANRAKAAKRVDEVC
jgi:hypothetical protein